MSNKFIKSVLLAILIFGLNLYIFRFQQIASFRDFLLYDRFNNIEKEKNLIQVSLGYIYNFFVQIFSPNWIASILFAIIFTVGFILCYKSLQVYLGYFRNFKLINNFNSDRYIKEIKEESLITNTQAEKLRKIKLADYLSSFLVISLTVLFVYNPFTLERFLMGQDKILLGYFLLFPLFNYALDWETKLNNKIFIKFTVISIILAFISIHFAIFSLILVLLLGFSKSNKLGLKAYLPAIIVFISIFSSFLFVYRANYQNTQEYYSNNIYFNPELSSQIIESFSPVFRPGYNYFVQSLIGSGSWNTPTFVEINGIYNNLSVLSGLSFYYNEFIAILYVIVLGLLWMLILIKSNVPYFRPFTKFIAGVSIILPVIFILNFGYFNGFFKNINFWFYNLPGSYIYRESGKFYGLFYTIIFYILVSASFYILSKKSLKNDTNGSNNQKLESLKKNYFYSSNQKQALNKTWNIKFEIIQIAYTGLILFFAISSLLPFLVLSDNLNYIKYPQAYKKSVEQCQNKKMLVLPDELYIEPKYSKVFMPNPMILEDLQKCNIVQPLRVTLRSRVNGLESILIEESSKEFKIVNALEKYYKGAKTSESKNGILDIDASKQKDNRDELLEVLKQEQVDYIFIDSNSLQNGFIIVSDLSIMSDLVFSDDGYYMLKLK